MKTCVVRRRFWATEADNTTVSVELEPGFGTPKAAMVIYAENNANTDSFDTSLAYKNFGIGFSDGTNEMCVNITLRDAQGTSDTQRSHYSTRFINAVISSLGTVYYRVDTVTFAQDKINLTFANSTPQTDGHLEALFWVISGDDVSAAVGYSSYSSTDGTSRVYSGLSFQPDIVFISGCYNTLNQTQSADAIISLGVAKRVSNQQVGTAWWQDDGVTTISTATRISDTLVNSYVSSTTGVVSATIGSYTANGWSMTNTGTFAANIVYNFLAIKTADPANDFALVDNFNTYTGTGRTFVGLGVSGFPADTLFGNLTYSSTRNAIQTSSTTGADALTFFAGTATSYSKLYNGTGSITYSTGSATVTGSGTSFWYFYPGVKLYTPEGLDIGQVSTVASATSLTLTANALLNGTTQPFTHSNHRQYAISLTEDDGGTTTVASTLISSSMFTIPDATTVQFQGYLDTPSTSPGFYYNVTNSDATSRFGWVLAANDRTNQNRRRGKMT